MRKWTNSRIDKEQGASAIEFAFAFPLLFLVFYGIVSYALVFAVQHTLSTAVAEGARVAMRFQTKNNDTVETRKTAACQSVKKTMQWLEKFGGAIACSGASNGAISVVTANASCTNALPANTSIHCVRVTASYAYRSRPIIPSLFSLMLPQQLSADALVQFNLHI